MNGIKRMQFYISRTKTDAESGNIVSVFVCGKNESQWCWVASAFVVQLINQGVPFNTLLKTGDRNYQVGSRVEVYEFALRTMANDTGGDNLESLPTVTV
ncbi:MAG TPA: hypothetical protein DIW52_27810 [Pseudomonas sp.]|nr:hypothetical protein [Pseudomonas sp.]